MATPHALPTTTATVLIRPRASASCSAPGKVLCNGPKQWGLCAEDTVDWEPTADGTICICSAGVCDIVASTDGQHGSSGAKSHAPPPATKSTTKHTHAHAHAHAPTYTSNSTSTQENPAHKTGAHKTSHRTSSASQTATSPTQSATVPGNGSAYTTFNGDGSVGDGWPAMTSWLSFESLYAANSPIGQGCETAFGVPNNSPSDNQMLHDAILKQASAVAVPPEFALAIVLQESLGCLFVGTTAAAVSNPGIMQDHDGKSTCAGKTTCPLSEINGMLRQGLNGTSSGAGIAQCHEQAPGSGTAQKWYQAARIYNGGSIPAGGDLTGSSAGTSCYASDVANRLIGWSKGDGGCEA